MPVLVVLVGVDGELAREPLQAFGIEGGRDYEKVESARLLSASEYRDSSPGAGSGC